MPNYHGQLDSTFKALSDPTRRAVLEQLSRGSQPMKALASSYKMALPSFSQHLDVLEDAGLVSSNKEGRTRIFSLNAKGIRNAETWLSRQRVVWEKRLDQLDNYLLKMQEEEK
jgi:DNA-binding transcriptional ArsR family regulator